MLKSKCHCGAVEIEVPTLPESLVQCTCSICRRYGALWGHFTRATASVNYKKESVKAYLWNDRVIEFYHCNTCGCLTHYEGVEKTSNERLSINFRMFPPVDFAGVKVRTFDGADTWKFLED
jgi:hypothetical protein